MLKCRTVIELQLRDGSTGRFQCRSHYYISTLGEWTL